MNTCKSDIKLFSEVSSSNQNAPLTLWDTRAQNLTTGHVMRRHVFVVLRYVVIRCGYVFLGRLRSGRVLVTLKQVALCNVFCVVWCPLSCLRCVLRGWAVVIRRTFTARLLHFMDTTVMIWVRQHTATSVMTVRKLQCDAVALEMKVYFTGCTLDKSGVVMLATMCIECNGKW